MAPVLRLEPLAAPHVALIVQSVIAAGIVILFAVVTGTGDPTQQAYLQFYGLMAVMTVIIILSVHESQRNTNRLAG